MGIGKEEIREYFGPEGIQCMFCGSVFTDFGCDSWEVNEESGTLKGDSF